MKVVGLCADIHDWYHDPVDLFRRVRRDIPLVPPQSTHRKFLDVVQGRGKRMA